MKEVGTRAEETCDKPIICGGAHPTFYPEVINDPYLDALCQGEGDDAMLAYLQALQNEIPDGNHRQPMGEERWSGPQK